MAEKVNIPLKAFAREVGRSHTWILRLVKDGRLPRNPDGTMPFTEALEKFNAIQEEAKEKKLDRASKNPPDLNIAMNKAKLAEKTYQARLKELEFKLKSGELLEKDAVAHEAQQLASKIKNKLLSIPPRVSAMCEGRVARDIEEIITDAINDALKELQGLKS